MLPPSLSKTDIHLLYVFATVVEARGFSAAQALLNTAPSTISRQISDLESRLNMQLCSRGRSGFKLTNDGQRTFEAIGELFSSLDQFKRTVLGKSRQLTGSLNIGVVDNWISNSEAPIVKTLSQFHDSAPNVVIDLHSLASDEIEFSLLDGRIDVGIGVFHQPKKGLHYKTICTDDMGLFCGREHPLFSDSDSNPEAKLSEINLARRAYLSEEKLTPITAKMNSTGQAHQIEGVAMLILTGKYVGYLPVTYAEPWVEGGLMRNIFAAQLNCQTDIQLAVRKSRTETKPLRLFLEILEKTAQHR